MTIRATLVLVAALCGTALAQPATLLTEKAQTGAAVDPVFAHLKFDRLRCKFSEAKHVALLAKPLTSTGTIYFDRDKGISRTTATPKIQQVLVTKTSLRIKTGDKVEEIPLDKSKDLKAFALVFPTLLRGERAELEKSFSISLQGKDGDWWALTFTPKADSLKKIVTSVVVIGNKAQPQALKIVEASGDTTETQLTELATNKDVPDAEITAAFQ
jgi:outer membrane lipoprotein-sorting protein